MYVHIYIIEKIELARFCDSLDLVTKKHKVKDNFEL